MTDLKNPNRIHKNGLISYIHIMPFKLDKNPPKLFFNVV